MVKSVKIRCQERYVEVIDLITRVRMLASTKPQFFENTVATASDRLRMQIEVSFARDFTHGAQDSHLSHHRCDNVNLPVDQNRP